MTLEGTYVEDRCVHLPDVNGFQAQIPVRDFEAVHRAANQSDDGRAYHQGRFDRTGRWFDREMLNGAAPLVDRLDRCTFTSPAGDCDQLAVFDLADPRPRCDNHHQEV